MMSSISLAASKVAADHVARFDVAVVTTATYRGVREIQFLAR
jgi:hypothetical protein